MSVSRNSWASHRAGVPFAEPLETRLLLAAIPAAPTDLRLQWVEPGRVSITFRDNATDETGFSINRQDPVAHTSVRVGSSDLPPNTPTDPSAVGDVTVYDTDPFLDPTHVYTYSVSVRNGSTGQAGPSGRVGYAAEGHGLRQRIWNDVDPVTFEPAGQPVVDRIDPTVDHTWGDGSPAPGIDPDTFAVEWTGEILGDPTSPLHLSVVANDGVRLFLDDKLVIAGGWRDQPATEYFADGAPDAGTRTRIRLETYDHTGPAVAQLFWNGSDGRRVIVPSQSLIPGSEDSLRMPAETHAAGLAAADGSGVDRIVVSWQDDAFAETGYEIQRSTRRDFAAGTLETFTAPAGSTQYVDDASGEFRTFYYRVRAVGRTADASSTRYSPWSSAACAAKVPERAGLYRPTFSTRGVAYNGAATPTASGTLDPAQRASTLPGSAFLNQAVAPSPRFHATFDVPQGAYGEGFAFVIQNVAAPPGGTQLNALGGALGYEGIGEHSVAVTFDLRGLPRMGVYTGGALNDDVEANDPDSPHRPNVSVDLSGAAGVFRSPTRVSLDYQEDDHGTIGDPSDDTGTFRIKLSAIESPQTIFLTARYDVYLPTVLGGNVAHVGFTGGPGSVKISNFSYGTGLVVERFPPEIFVRSSVWSDSFLQGLASRGLGDARLGFELDRFNANPTLPWTNVDQVVVRGLYNLPDLIDFEVQGTRGTYAPTSVEKVAGTSDTYLLTLDKPLGGGAGSGLNGDRILLNIYPCNCCSDGAPLPPFTVTLNVVQGDVNQSGSVLANDYSEVKARFFKNTKSPVTGTNDYDAFHDVDGSGSILANDYSAAKARFFNSLPPAPAPAAPPPGQSARPAPPRRTSAYVLT